MKLPFLLIVALFFAACDNVVFTAPQPSGAKPLKKFPDEMVGQWVQEKNGVTDKLTIEETSCRLESSDKNRTRHGELDTLNFVLKKYNNKDNHYFIISEKSDSGYYRIRFVLLEDENKLAFYKVQSGNMDIISEVTDVTVIADHPRYGKFYAINPDKKALSTIVRKNLLLKTDEFERVYEE